VVLTSGRIAEDRHHTAADEALDGAAPPVEHLAEDVRPAGGLPTSAFRVRATP
jgi:hypothetical protein